MAEGSTPVMKKDIFSSRSQLSGRLHNGCISVTFVERISCIICSRFGNVDIIGAVIRYHDRAAFLH
jgi:hypothetical protein